jgi:hypothetical protein
MLGISVTLVTAAASPDITSDIAVGRRLGGARHADGAAAPGTLSDHRPAWPHAGAPALAEQARGRSRARRGREGGRSAGPALVGIVRLRGRIPPPGRPERALPTSVRLFDFCSPDESAESGHLAGRSETLRVYIAGGNGWPSRLEACTERWLEWGDASLPDHRRLVGHRCRRGARAWPLPKPPSRSTPARTAAGAERVAQAVSAAGREPLILEGDLGQPAAGTRLVEETVARFGSSMPWSATRASPTAGLSARSTAPRGMPRSLP